LATLRELGQTHGIYGIGRHEIVTSDMELILDVLVKKFSHFRNRLSLFPNPKSTVAKESVS